MFSKHQLTGLAAFSAAFMFILVGPANAQFVSGSTPQGLRADGLRLQGLAERYAELRPAASFYTPQALRADGLRWQGLAASYANDRRVVTVANESGFQWGDAGIGALGGLALAACAMAAVVFVRRSRRTKLAL